MKRYFIIATIMVAGFGFYINNASAFLMLSGDSNITNTSSSLDNIDFLENVIGAGSTVSIMRGISTGGDFNSVFNSMSGVTSTEVSDGTAITAATLSGVDLFMPIMPTDAFSSSEITAMSDFLASGGDIFFIAENQGTFFTTSNGIVNDALSALGSSLSLVNDGVLLDTGFHTTTNIFSDALTTDVNQFEYALFTKLKVNGGIALIDGITSGQTIIAYESTAEPVPEPATVALLGMGLTGLAGGAARRRWKKKSVD